MYKCILILQVTRLCVKISALSAIGLINCDLTKHDCVTYSRTRKYVYRCRETETSQDRQGGWGGKLEGSFKNWTCYALLLYDISKVFFCIIVRSIAITCKHLVKFFISKWNVVEIRPTHKIVRLSKKNSIKERNICIYICFKSQHEVYVSLSKWNTLEKIQTAHTIFKVFIQSVFKS